MKNNKLATFLLIVVILLVAGQLNPNRGVMPFTSFSKRSASFDSYGGGVAMQSAPMMGEASLDMVSMPFVGEAAPAPEVANRMIVTDSYLSLVVEDVSAAIEAAKTYTTGLGGYFVNSSVNRPEEGGMGTLSLRIPAEKLPEALEHFRGQAVTVVSEDLTGTDVTDQFVDNEERLRVLEMNKATFEQIMARATDVEDIVRVQQEIFSLQSQIEAIKGQQQYMEQTSKMALVTLYLSTDELSLPYAPADTWRPEVIFKTAVRQLVTTIRGIGSALIWIGVYAVIWLPLLIIGILLNRYWARRKINRPQN